MNKKELLNRFATAYKQDGFPPLAGRVMGLFYISNKKYLSFEEIINETNASKGAVSKTIKLLIQMHRIDFIISEEKARKRLFYLDIEGLKYFIRMIINNYRDQDQLLKECLQTRTNENEEMNNFIKDSLNFNKDVLTFLNIKNEQYFNK